MSFVRFENVDLAYAPGGALAVQGLNLDIAEGEFVAVVGPSGCGKSTLMKLASGLRPPSNGYVFVDGREVGVVTSGSFAPSVGNSVALAYIAAEQAEAADYIVRAAKVDLPARAATLPFYPGGTARAALL